MQEWIAAQLAAGLPAFAGSTISGTVAVSPDAINELIAGWLAGTGVRAGSPEIDLTRVRAALKSARVRVDRDRILIDIDVRL
jgi:hypothetical protein